MLIRHQGAEPVVDSTAWVAPDATLCGNVRIGPHARVLHGARIIAEGGSILIVAHVIVLQNAIIRSTPQHDTVIDDHVLIGPHTHVVGCRIEEEVFVATGASIFHGATLETGSEVRICGVVHVCSRVASGETVPIGWIAVGDPAEILPPGAHERIWATQQSLNFPEVVYGIDRSEANLRVITERLSEVYDGHRDDAVVDEAP